jgi:hypothetical protein
MDETAMSDSEDLWALRQALEENPSDHELRWKVAKSFYSACEYRQALEDLQILRNEWEPRLNVVRYLSATYYRLGRYEEAARELRSGVKTWPTEIVLQEQLARVLEVAGKLLEAAKIWEGIGKLQPEHPLANSAAKRLHRKAEGKYNEEATDLTLDSEDSGINLKPGQTCSNCGAHNALDAELCWQCQSPIYSVRTPRPTRRIGPIASPAGTGNVPRLVGGAVTVLLLAMCVYLTMRDLSAMAGPVEVIGDYFYRHTLAPTRIVLGMGLLVVWPLVFYLVIYASGVPQIPLGTVTVAGLGLAAVTFWLSFSSILGLAMGLVIALMASLGVLFLGFPLKPREVLSAWLYQALMIIVAAVTIVTVTEWSRTGVFFNPVRDLPALSSAMRMPLQNPELLFTRDFSESLPCRTRIQWESSGSPWLDHYAEDIRLEITPKGQGALALDFLDAAGRTIGFETQIRAVQVKTYAIDLGQPYTLKITGDEGDSVGIRIAGVLPHRILSTPF